MKFDYLARHGITSTPVLRAMEHVPRERFVQEADRPDAYANRPLPIGFGQTISQPYVVAFVLEALDLRPGERVLEVGSGSGYLLALLSELGAAVFGVEVVPGLAERSAVTLRELGYNDAEVRVGNGRDGWIERAPFDAIVVSAAADALPAALPGQLADGGRIIAPLGAAEAQQLVRVTIGDAGTPLSQTLLPVRFVPLVDPRC